jgi:uncharacterized protein YndB with AHSA1/START domain/predicted enzyme related to lactoylglutathione lyase
MSRDIRCSVDIAAPAERVFECLTSADDLLAWWTDPGFPATHWEIDLRPGGRWLSRWRTPTGDEFSLGGTIVTVDPPRVLEYTWVDERYPGLPPTQVRYEIQSSARGCRVHMSHTGFDDERKDFHDYNNGWSTVFHKLHRHVDPHGSFRSNRDVAIEVADLGAARAFYGEALGFPLWSSSEMHLEYDTGTFRLWINASPRPQSFTLSFDVADSEAARRVVEEAGGRVVRSSAEGFQFTDPSGFLVDVVKRG